MTVTPRSSVDADLASASTDVGLVRREQVLYAPLTVADISALEAALRVDAVYEHIGGTPSRADFVLGMERALRGPPASRPDERWINYVVHAASSATPGSGIALPVAPGPALGRLEATVHDGIAEVAFLFAPHCWGRGLATQGLQWLQEQLRADHDVSQFWATTLPANARCRALLRRCGYEPADPARRPRLYSHDDGDLVFSLTAGALGRHTPQQSADPSSPHK